MGCALLVALLFRGRVFDRGQSQTDSGASHTLVEGERVEHVVGRADNGSGFEVLEYTEDVVGRLVWRCNALHVPAALGRRLVKLRHQRVGVFLRFPLDFRGPNSDRLAVRLAGLRRRSRGLVPAQSLAHGAKELLSAVSHRPFPERL